MTLYIPSAGWKLQLHVYSVSHRAGSSILAEVHIHALIHIFLTCGTSVVLSTFAQERAICVLNILHVHIQIHWIGIGDVLIYLPLPDRDGAISKL